MDHQCPSARKAVRDEAEAQDRRRQHDHRGRDWSNAAPSQGTPAASRCQKRQGRRPLERLPPHYFNFRFLASRTVKE